MARKRARPLAKKQVMLDLLQTTCRMCGNRLQMARHGHRKVTRLDGVYPGKPLVLLFDCLVQEIKQGASPYQVT